MAVSVKSVLITPSNVTVNEQITITVRAEDVTWNTIKTDFSSWSDVKTSLTNWKAVQNYN